MDLKSNLNDIMKEAQKMQDRMQKAQEELSNVVITGEAGAGLVKVSMNGRHDCKKVQINPNLLDDDIEMLEDLVCAAINDAVQKIEKKTKDKIMDLTSGLQLPKELQDIADKEGGEGGNQGSGA